MKMKKIFLLFSMLTLLFSLTACDDGQGEVEFAYNDFDVTLASVSWAQQFQNITPEYRAYIENEGDDVYKLGLSNFDAAENECGKFEGFRVKDKDGNVDTNNSANIMVEALLSKDEEVRATALQQVENLYLEITEEGQNVVVILQAEYQKRDVELRFVYGEDPSNLYNQQAAPFKLIEVVATPDYTFGEKMGKAGMNTLMGMGTVFAVLIFISFIIEQFKWISVFTNKKNIKLKNEESVTNKTLDAAESNLMNDTELVAVITAAIMDENKASGCSDQLVVRSIKKAKR